MLVKPIANQLIIAIINNICQLTRGLTSHLFIQLSPRYSAGILFNVTVKSKFVVRTVWREFLQSTYTTAH